MPQRRDIKDGAKHDLAYYIFLNIFWAIIGNDTWWNFSK